MKIIEDLKKMDVGKIDTNVYLKDYTTFKVGGKALGIIYPDDIDDLCDIIKYLKDNDVKFKVLGNGSNVIFSDYDYNGIIIKLSNFNNLDIKGNLINVGAGYMLNKLSLRLSRLGYSGLEFAAGIPGTIGGAIYMNAGAYKSDMGYITTSVKVLTPNYEIKTLENDKLDFHYRSSFFQKNPGYTVLEATLCLPKGNPEEIMELINTRKQRRIESQPLEYPSAGSVFRNPEGDFAGRLIEEIGYKGKKLGGAQVSEKHANFIINTGNATSQDIKRLINEIQEKVKEKFGIELRAEQEFVE